MHTCVLTFLAVLMLSNPAVSVAWAPLSPAEGVTPVFGDLLPVRVWREPDVCGDVRVDEPIRPHGWVPVRRACGYGSAAAYKDAAST